MPENAPKEVVGLVVAVEEEEDVEKANVTNVTVMDILLASAEKNRTGATAVTAWDTYQEIASKILMVRLVTTAIRVATLLEIVQNRPMDSEVVPAVVEVVHVITATKLATLHATAQMDP